MQNVGQFGPGTASARPPTQFVPSEPSPNGGSTTTSLRQFRKKDVEKSVSNQQVEQQEVLGKPMSESHVARVAPHNHYPAAPPPSSATSNDAVYHRYPSGTTHPFAGYSPQVKYSELAEPSQPNPISTSVIQKPKPKDYTNMDMCNVQPQHLSNHQQYSPDNGQYMHKDPSQGYPSGYHKPPESHYFSKEQPHQYQHQLAAHHPGMPKYNTMLATSNMRKYNPSEGPFLNKLGKIHPSMNRPMSLNDHPHLQEGQSGYSPMEQRAGLYSQQNHRYYAGSMPQPNPYSPNSNYSMNNAHPAYANYPAGSCNYPRTTQISMGSRYTYMERSMSPSRRTYAESMHVPHQMNFHPMHQKIASTHNYSPQYNRAPEYAQHYQHRRMAPDVYPQTCRPAQYMQSHPAPDLQELTESTVSPSESLKTFIESFAVDEEPPSDLNSVDSSPISLREKLRDETPAGTVYMINASDVQYFENTGIPIVTSDNGGFQLTSENYQYLLKNGLISIESSGNQDRVVNLQIMEGSKSDCMLADKHIRPPEASLNPAGSKPPEDENSRRIMIHQQAILNSSGNVVIEKSLQKKDQSASTLVDNLSSSTKELVDKNCSPINLDHLEHNLGLIEPNNTQTDSKTDSSPNINCSNDQHSLLSDDLSQHSEDSQSQKSPGSKSMPIIDFFAENAIAPNDDSCEADESKFSLTRKDSLSTVLNSLTETEQDKSQLEAVEIKDLKTSVERSTGTPTVIVTPESSRMGQATCDSESCKINNEHEELTTSSVISDNFEGPVKKRKRIFSVDDIIGTKMKKVHIDVDAAKDTLEFLERERACASGLCINSKQKNETDGTKSNDEETIRVKNSSVVLELAGELLRISVGVVNGKTVINVKPISDSMIVVDYNQNYQKSSEQMEESTEPAEDTLDFEATAAKDDNIQKITENPKMEVEEEVKLQDKEINNIEEIPQDDEQTLNVEAEAAVNADDKDSAKADVFAVEEPTDLSKRNTKESKPESTEIEVTNLMHLENPILKSSLDECLLETTETNVASEIFSANQTKIEVETSDNPTSPKDDTINNISAEVVEVKNASVSLADDPVVNTEISSDEPIDLKVDSSENSGDLLLTVTVDNNVNSVETLNIEEYVANTPETVISYMARHENEIIPDSQDPASNDEKSCEIVLHDGKNSSNAEETSENVLGEVECSIEAKESCESIQEEERIQEIPHIVESSEDIVEAIAEVLVEDITPDNESIHDEEANSIEICILKEEGNSAVEAAETIAESNDIPSVLAIEAVIDQSAQEQQENLNVSVKSSVESSENEKSETDGYQEVEVANAELEIKKPEQFCTTVVESIEVPVQEIRVEQENECVETVVLIESDIVAEISEESTELGETETLVNAIVITESSNDEEDNTIELLKTNDNQVSLLEDNSTVTTIKTCSGEEVGFVQKNTDGEEELATEKCELLKLEESSPPEETLPQESSNDPEEVVSSHEANNGVPTEPISAHSENYQEETESEFALEDFSLEDEVFIEEPPAHELVVADPLEGIGVIDGPDVLSQSPEIPLEAVSTSVILDDHASCLDPLDSNCNIVASNALKEPKEEIKNATKIKPEVQILSPTSTNVEDHPQSLKANVYLELKRKYSTDNDVSESSPTLTVTTKAAKKMYESDFQVQHDIVSSSKKEAPKSRKSNLKRSKRLTEKSQVRNEQKEMLKLLSEKRKRQKQRELLKQTDKKEVGDVDKRLAAPSNNKVDEQEEEFVDFRELLKARKLKKMKKMQELAASASSSKVDLSESVKGKPVSTVAKRKEASSIREKKKERSKSCCIGCGSGSSSKPGSEGSKQTKKVELKEEKAENCSKIEVKLVKIEDSPAIKPVAAVPPLTPKPNQIITKQLKLSDKHRLHRRRISSYENILSSTSNAVNKNPRTTEVIHSAYLKDPRRRSKSFTGQIMVPSVSELIEENGGSSSKKKISLADYVSRKRKESTKDVLEADKRLKLDSGGYERSDSSESVSTSFSSEDGSKARSLSDVKTSFVIHSSDWEDSNSPVSSPQQSKEVCLIEDFSGLIRNTSTKKPVIDLNELLPSADKKLQEYKEKVDSQLSSLNIQIPKIKPYSPEKSSRPNLGPFGSPKSSSLVQRFLKDEKLTPEEMCRIRKIISYKRSMQQNSKNVKSPSKSLSTKCGSEAATDRSPNPNYEVRTSEEAREVRLCLKRVASKSRKIDFDEEKDSSSVTMNQSPNKNVGYSVFNRLGEDGLPKIVFKRKMKISMLRQPVVQLVKLNLDDLDRIKKEFNVTVRQIM